MHYAATVTMELEKDGRANRITLSILI